MSDLEAVKVAEKVVPAFMDVAKSCIQLSVGVLTLSIAFRDKIIESVWSKGWLIFSWISFLISIMAGALYLHLAAKRITNYLSSDAAREALQESLHFSNPHWAYVIMGGFFVSGVFFLVLASILTLFKKH